MIIDQPPSFSAATTEVGVEEVVIAPDVNYVNPSEAIASITSELAKAHDLIGHLEAKNTQLQSTVIQLETKLATGTDFKSSLSLQSTTRLGS